MSEGDLHQPHHGGYPDAPASGSSLLNCSQQDDRVAFLSLYRCEQLGVNKLAGESSYFSDWPDVAGQS